MIAGVCPRDFPVAAHFVLGGVVTVVDAASAMITARTNMEVGAQMSAADRVVLSKLDLAVKKKARDVRRWVRSVNPLAEVLAATDTGLLAVTTDEWRFSTWTAADLPPTHAVMPTAAVSFSTPVAGDALSPWLDLVVATGGIGLLRVKGIVRDVDGAPLAIHAV